MAENYTHHLTLTAMQLTGRSPGMSFLCSAPEQLLTVALSQAMLQLTHFQMRSFYAYLISACAVINRTRVSLGSDG